MSNSLRPKGTAAHQAPLSSTLSGSLLKLMFTESVIPPNHLILCHPLLLLPSIFPSIRSFPELALYIRWPKYWSFSNSCSNEYSGLISLDWLVWSYCSPRDSRESSPAPQFKSINSSALSLLYAPTLTFTLDGWKAMKRTTRLAAGSLEQRCKQLSTSSQTRGRHCADNRSGHRWFCSPGTERNVSYSRMTSFDQWTVNGNDDGHLWAGALRT